MLWPIVKEIHVDLNFAEKYINNRFGNLQIVILQLQTIFFTNQPPKI